MDKPASSALPLWNQLFQLRAKDELIALVHAQLASDFQRAGCPLPFDATLSPRLWNEQLTPLLQQQPAHILQQLIYLIDLPEQLVRAMLPAENYLQQLADAIIYRELVKVYYKITYSA